MIGDSLFTVGEGKAGSAAGLPYPFPVERKSDKPPQTISVVEYDEPRGEIAGEAVAEILAAEIVHGKPYTCPADKPSKGKEVAKADQIFNYLLKDKQIQLPDGHRMPAAEKRYCKWHNYYTHATCMC